MEVFRFKDVVVFDRRIVYRSLGLLEIEAAAQNLLYFGIRTPAGLESPATSGFEPLSTIRPCKADNALTRSCIPSNSDEISSI
jgi:hypothetical protein